jgi:hypothetical protein
MTMITPKPQVPIVKVLSVIKNSLFSKAALRQFPLYIGAILLTGIASGLFVITKLRFNEESRHSSFACYTRDEVIGTLKRANINIDNYFTLRRNASRDRFYISPYFTPSGNALLVISSENVRICKCPGSIVYLNPAEDIVAWSNDLSEGVRFANGYFLSIPNYGLFDVAPSGRYFIIGEKPASTWIGSLAQPESRILISTNTLGSHVLEAAGKLYVAGQSFRQMADGRILQEAKCLVLEIGTQDMKLIDTIHFPVSATVEDVSQSGDQMLLKETTEFSSHWILYDVGTKQLKKLGVANGWCFFMKNSDLLEGVRNGNGSVRSNDTK